jgi:DNA-directed RNA polymerase specialized sigma24 family protein
MVRAREVTEARISALGLRRLRRMASRRARTADEADDLVQDTLAAALEEGRDIDGPRFFAWASGVLKRRALFLARTAVRRRRRDTNFAVEAAVEAAQPFAPERRLPRQFTDSLPASVRTIALLVNAGLSRAEIASVLGISDLALRQRISWLRRAWRRSGAHPDFAEPQQLLPCGLARRSLKATLVRLPAARSAVADPDGHEIYLSVAHNSRARGN